MFLCFYYFTTERKIHTHRTRRPTAAGGGGVRKNKGFFRDILDDRNRIAVKDHHSNNNKSRDSERIIDVVKNRKRKAALWPCLIFSAGGISISPQQKQLYFIHFLRSLPEKINGACYSLVFVHLYILVWEESYFKPFQITKNIIYFCDKLIYIKKRIHSCLCYEQSLKF